MYIDYTGATTGGLNLAKPHSQAVPTSNLGVRLSLVCDTSTLGQEGAKTILAIHTLLRIIIHITLPLIHQTSTNYPLHNIILCTHNIKWQYSELLSLLARQLGESDGASVVFVSCASSSTVLSPSTNLTPPSFPQQQIEVAQQQYTTTSKTFLPAYMCIHVAQQQEITNTSLNVYIYRMVIYMSNLQW